MMYPWQKEKIESVLKKIPSRKRNFSLIELLVVIAIIAILTGILLPALNSARKKAKSVACINNLKTCALKMNFYADDWEDFLPAVSDSDGRTWSYLLGPKHTALMWKFEGYPDYRCPYEIIGTDTTAARYFTYGMNCYLKDGGQWSINYYPKRTQIGKKGGSWVPKGVPSSILVLTDTLTTGRTEQHYMMNSNSGAIHLRHNNLTNGLMLDGSAQSLGLGALSSRCSGSGNVMTETMDLFTF